MCGIHGIITSKKRQINADDFIKDGFVAGSLRGTDSSGIAVIDAARVNYTLSKLPVSGPMFITDKYTQQVIRDSCDVNTITICHTRSATSGKISLNEAHPFYVEDDRDGGRDLVGVHNGTLTSWRSKPLSDKFTVDSEWALNHIFNEGVDAFEDFVGAYCFVWWDSVEQDILNIALNDQRPMFIAFTEDGGMAYASEAGMISWLCQRNNIKILGSILSLAAKHLYKFPVEDPSKFTKLTLPEPKYQASPVPTNFHGHDSRRYAPYRDIMTRVRSMLLVVGAKATSHPNPTNTASDLVPKIPPKSPTITASEQQAARDLGMMNSRGTFTPFWVNEATGELYGKLTCQNSEFTGIIRNASLIPWEATTVWAVGVIGVANDDKEIIAICGRPVCTIKRKPIIESTAEKVY